MAQCGFLSVTEMVEALSETLYLKPGYGKEGNHWIITDIQPRHNSSGSSTQTFSICEQVSICTPISGLKNV